MAERIAVRSSKTAILAAYVNRVPMGGNLYGVEAAARTYFGEPASDLDLAQASLLAAIPNDPARLSPDVEWGALRARQRFVLGEWSPCTTSPRREPTRPSPRRSRVRRHDAGIADAAHALFALYRQLPPGDGRIRTTIDRSLQRFVQVRPTTSSAHSRTIT